MKILHILPPSNLGDINPEFNSNGLVKSVYLLDKALTEMGQDSRVAWTKTSKITGHLYPILDNALKEKGEIINFSLEKFKEYKRRIKEILNRESFDVIHSHTAPIMWDFRKEKTVLTFRLPPEFAMQTAGTFFPKQIKLISVSKSQKNSYLKKNIFVEKVIFNGIDLENFPITDKSYSEREYFLSLGRIDFSKGQHHAIEISLKTKIPLIIAGPIWDYDYFNKNINPHLNNKLIRYIGLCDKNERKKLLKNSKALLMPIEWEEPFSLVVLEALATGIPILGFKKGSLEEVVHNNENGFLLESVNDLVGNIQKLEHITPTMCRESVNNYDYFRTAKKYIKIYES